VYKNNAIGDGKNDIVDDLRRRSVAVYLAAETSLSVIISHELRHASNEIERLRSMSRVMFWLIVVMNTVVIACAQGRDGPTRRDQLCLDTNPQKVGFAHCSKLRQTVLWL
jgi:hypothetical protein